MSGSHSTMRAARKSVAFTTDHLSATTLSPIHCGSKREADRGWQQVRLYELTNALDELLILRSAGVGIIAAAAIISDRFSGRRLTVRKRLRASSKTIQRLFYRWRRSRDPRLLVLNYKPCVPRYQRELQRELRRIWIGAL